MEINLSDITNYVEANIDKFHQKRIQSLDSLSLTQVLKRKNPYLFKAKYMLTAQEIIKALVDAHISSNEETIFGDWLEGLAVFVNQKVYFGRKSGITGIDLEFDKGGTRYLVSIKSGPNWGNSSQIKKMIDHFNSARKTLKTAGSNIQVVAVNGCCYGKESNPYKAQGDYYKYCGQEFWEFISGNPTLYTELIIPLGHKAKERNDDFSQSYARMLNKFTLEFSKHFCTVDGDIDWQKLVIFNSGKK